MLNFRHRSCGVDNVNQVQTIVARSAPCTGRLDDEGYTGNIQNGFMSFSKGSMIVARARKINTLYLMHARICWEEVNVVGDNVGELWHKRLCHMSLKGMRRLTEANLIPEVKNIVAEFRTDA